MGVWKRLLLLLILSAAFGCAHSGKPPASEMPVIISRTGPITESDLGVPIYPGASAVEGKSFLHRTDSTAPASNAFVSLSTPDSTDKAESFYREKLGRDLRVSHYDTAGGKLTHMSLAGRDRLIQIEILPLSKGPGTAIVILTQTFRKGP